MKPKLSDILGLDSLVAAPRLLGWTICRRTTKGVIGLKIVEVEAYHQSDLASHSFAGLTKRTAPMFAGGGLIYVYFNYGMHHAINLVTGPKGSGQAVLLRAAEPLEGIEIMRRNRGVSDLHQLASGPGKLAQALGIKSTQLSGQPLAKNTLYLEPPAEPVKPKNIVAGPRIGITKAVDEPWRFYLKDNPFISKI